MILKWGVFNYKYRIPAFENSQGTAKHEIKYDAGASSLTLPCIFLSFDNSNKIGWLSKSNLRLNEAVKVGVMKKKLEQ